MGEVGWGLRTETKECAECQGAAAGVAGEGEQGQAPGEGRRLEQTELETGRPGRRGWRALGSQGDGARRQPELHARPVEHKAKEDGGAGSAA